MFRKTTCIKIFRSVLIAFSLAATVKDSQAFPAKVRTLLLDGSSIINDASPSPLPNSLSTFIAYHFSATTQAAAGVYINERLYGSVSNLIAIKTLNPNFQAFGYADINAQYVSIRQGSPTTPNSIAVFDSTGKMTPLVLFANGSYMTDPDTFLGNPATGHPLCTYGGPEGYIQMYMNPRSQNYFNLFKNIIQPILSPIQEPTGTIPTPYDGIQLDDTWGDFCVHANSCGVYDFSMSSVPLSNVSISTVDPSYMSPLDATTVFNSIYGTDSIYGGFDFAVSNFINSVTAYVASLNSQYGVKKSVYINGVQGDGRTEGIPSPQTGDSYAEEYYLNQTSTPLNGFSIEGYSSYVDIKRDPEWSENVKHLAIYSAAPYTPAGRGLGIAASYGLMAPVCPYFYPPYNFARSSINQPPSTLPNGYGGLSLDQLMNFRIYGIASYLMAESDKTYYCFTTLDASFPYYLPECDLRYGAPNGAMQTHPFTDATDSTRQSNYYERDFQNAMVYVNPSQVCGQTGNLMPSAAITSPNFNVLMMNLNNVDVAGLNYNGNTNGPTPAGLPTYTSPGYVSYIPVPANTQLTLPPLSAMILVGSADYEAQALYLASASSMNNPSIKLMPVPNFTSQAGVVVSNINNKIVFTLPDFPGGTYAIQVKVQKGPAGATWRATMQDASGSLQTSLPMDDYSPNTTGGTDLLGVVNLIPIAGVPHGDRTLTLILTGLNPAAPGGTIPSLTLDYIRLVPQ